MLDNHHWKWLAPLLDGISAVGAHDDGPDAAQEHRAQLKNCSFQFKYVSLEAKLISYFVHLELFVHLKPSFDVSHLQLSII